MSAYVPWDRRMVARRPWHSLWGAVYGNLMTCVAIFFLVLFISSQGAKYQDAIDALSRQFGASRAKRRNDLYSKFGTEQIAKIEFREDRMRIVFGSPVLFDSGSDKLKPSAIKHLGRLTAGLLNMPNPIQIEGYTDDQPLAPGSPFHSNWELSAARAFAVLQFMHKEGIPARRLSAIGYGEFHPLRPNDTPADRAVNRRIEIVLLRRQDQ
ncbi:MAG: flagellar motor protein MotB [Elusimicrobia bacterium]|nr:flagellar motor protein MotB [Elusimicrobiota bacterium]MDE2426886.1 flagellar motor protein MotB [Elusimicrobiota bacterium]